MSHDQPFVDQPVSYGKHQLFSGIEDYEQAWQASVKDPEKFWAKMAAEFLSFDQTWDSVLEWKSPHAKWFNGSQLNVAYNCLDRHLKLHAKKPAIIWEGEPGDQRTLSYQDLFHEVGKFANVLRELGITCGDRVTLYMPMVPECVIAMLACTRIGAIHNIVFAGFSAEALAERSNDCQAKLMITADGLYRKGEKVSLKTQVDEALTLTKTIEKVIILRRTEQPITMKSGRDLWWHELMATASASCPHVPVAAEHPLFILYTSGSTGKPKGVLHTTAGYLLNVASTFKQVFDIRANDIYWCTADIGWITGHSYVVYGPLANAATIFMYEGALLYPEPDRVWKLIEKHKISIFYTAPTAIRSFIKLGNQWPAKHQLSSLRLLGSVGEPINPSAWHWYFDVIGGKRCPIVDTWWQTETGGIMVSPLPGVTPMLPGSATKPLLGIKVDIVDADGQSVGPDTHGYFVVRIPWPGMLRTLYQDDARYAETYWKRFPNMYFTGDGAKRDDQGNISILGRVDDVINASGHRLSTMEVESALVSHELVAEAACVGAPDEMTGEAIWAFVTLNEGRHGSDALVKELQEHVSHKIGKLAKPQTVVFTTNLPKTRSGKIMRRLLRDVAAKRDIKGDTSTLEDFSVLAQLQEYQKD